MSKRIQLTLWLLVLLLLSMTGTACGNSSVEFDGDSVVSETSDGSARLRIGSNKTIYQPGDVVYISASIENLTNKGVDYTLWNIGDPVIYVYLEDTPYAARQGLFEEDHVSQRILPAVTGAVLQPAELLRRRVVWNQQLNTYPDAIQAPNGSYTIRCDFFLGTYSSGHEPTRLSTSIEIQIEKSWQIIKPEEAAEIARVVPQVADWYAEHTGTHLVKYEDGQAYLFFFSEWQPVDSNFMADGMTLDEIAQKYVPDQNVLMVDESWEVHFFTKFGPQPNEMIVKVEPTTGKVLSFESGK